MLTMYINQFLAQFLHLSQGGRSVVDEGTTLAGSIQFPTKDTFLSFVLQFMLLEETFQLIGGYIETGFYDTLGSPILNSLDIRTLAY